MRYFRLKLLQIEHTTRFKIPSTLTVKLGIQKHKIFHETIKTKFCQDKISRYKNIGRINLLT